MRLFTAIDIPEDVRGALAAAMERWKPLAKISWSPTQNLHITTKFIGGWPEARLEELKLALAAVRIGRNEPGLTPRLQAEACSTDIAIRGIGWFPNERRPRVLWAGVEADASLAKLAHAMEQAVTALRVAVEERPYFPHMTLARIREAVLLDALRAAIAKDKSEFGSFRAEQFMLYSSAAGRYTALASFPLC